jgi:potassium-transporting ATPase KdpC subunit
MREQIKPALLLFVWLTLLTGIAYPLLVTAIAQLCFPAQANGSLIGNNGKYATDPLTAAGSLLIGQPFSSAGYFWSRPSATGSFPYNAAASSGSNLGPLNPAQAEAVSQRAAALTPAGKQPASVPVDLLTASGSGLDPDISPAAALYQVARVAQARGFDPAQLEELVRSHITGRTFGVLGEPRANVLRLNLALDGLSQRQGGQ